MSKHNVNELVLNSFDFENSSLTTIQGGSLIWFLGKEVADILGYKNSRDALNKHIDEEDKKTLMYKDCREMRQANMIWNSNDYSNKTLINESGLYSLVLSSKMPNAKKFKHWVTSEVLPNLRQNGNYSIKGINNNITNFESLGKQIDQALQKYNDDLSMQLDNKMVQIQDDINIRLDEMMEDYQNYFAGLQGTLDSQNYLLANNQHISKDGDSINVPENWRGVSNDVIKHIANVSYGNSRWSGKVRKEIYDKMCSTAKIRIVRRLHEFQRKTNNDKATMVDMIASKREFIVLYLSEVRKLAIETNVWNGEY